MKELKETSISYIDPLNHIYNHENYTNLEANIKALKWSFNECLYEYYVYGNTFYMPGNASEPFTVIINPNGTLTLLENDGDTCIYQNVIGFHFGNATLKEITQELKNEEDLIFMVNKFYGGCLPNGEKLR